MEIKEEFKAFIEIKTEKPDDYYSEPYDYSVGCFEMIEIGKEFKSEPLETEQILEDHSKQTGESDRLICCTKCGKQWNYVPRKKESSCSKCGTILQYKCGKCMKIYKTLNTLQNHIKLKPSEKKTATKFCCDHCKYKTNYKGNLLSHIQAKHLPRDPNLNKCQKCGKTYSWRRDLLRHSKICGQTEDAKYLLMRLSCDHCEYKTSEKSCLSVHIQAKHLPRDPNLNKCTKCAKSFSQRSHLIWHSKICGQSKKARNLLMRFSCDHCKYKTDHKHVLSNHMRAKHLPRNPNLNKCTKCSKNYSWRSDLLKHSKICGKTEDFKCSLMRFSCDYCQYKTNRKGNLSRHIEEKHLPQDLNLNKCKNCGKSFARRSNLLSHSKICSTKKL